MKQSAASGNSGCPLSVLTPVQFLRFALPIRSTITASHRGWCGVLCNEGKVMRALPLLALCAAVVSSAAQAAPVNYISQERVATARAGDTDTVEAPDFGPFDGVAMASAENEDTRVCAETRL